MLVPAAHPPYFFWAIITDPARRSQLLREGWQHLGKLFLAAITLDLIYERIIYRGICPTQVLLTAVTLAFVPYALLRGVVTRISTRILRARKPAYGRSS